MTLRNLLAAGIAATFLLCGPARTAFCDSGANPNKLLRQGNKAFSQEQYDQALNSYSDALAVSPKDGRVYYNAANTLYKMKEYEKAIEAYAPAEADARVAQSSSFNKGNAYFRQDMYKEAVQSYRRAVLQDLKDKDAKYNLQMALERQKSPPQNQCKNPQKGGGGSEQDKKDQSGGQQDKKNDKSGVQSKSSRDDEKKKNDQENQQGGQKQKDKKDGQENQQDGQDQKDKKQQSGGGMSKEEADRLLQMAKEKENEATQNRSARTLQSNRKEQSQTPSNEEDW